MFLIGYIISNIVNILLEFRQVIFEFFFVLFRLFFILVTEIDVLTL